MHPFIILLPNLIPLAFLLMRHHAPVFKYLFYISCTIVGVPYMIYVARKWL